MLNGFEDITQPLSEQEEKMVPVIAAGLNKCIGEEKALTNKTICAFIENKYQVKLTEPRLRAIINRISMKDLAPGLCATSKGYFITRDIKKARAYADSLKGRMEAIRARYEKAIEYVKSLELQQQSSFF